MVERCSDCVFGQTTDCPLGSKEELLTGDASFGIEASTLLAKVLESPNFESVKPELCKVFQRHKPIARENRISRLVSIIFAEMAYQYTREQLIDSGLEVLSPELTSEIFILAGKARSIIPDGLVVDLVDEGSKNIARIVAVCEYTSAKKPAGSQGKKMQCGAYRQGKFLSFVNKVDRETKEAIGEAIFGEIGVKAALTFDSSKYKGAYLGVTDDPSTILSLAKLNLLGQEYRLPVQKGSLEEYAESLLDFRSTFV